MDIWIQALSWTLIYALGQGLLVFSALWLVLKLVPTTSANIRYHLSLSALTILLTWFVATLLQQYRAVAEVYVQMNSASDAGIKAVVLQSFANLSEAGIMYFVLTFLKAAFPWMSGLYIAGLAVMLVRLFLGTKQLLFLKRAGLTNPGAALDQLLVTLKERIKWSGSVQLFISVQAKVPMVIGFFKPVILLPAAALAQLNAEQLETILLHELAHIKRRDYLINMLQTIVETVLFFNPFVWLISRVCRREREHCCDDIVLSHTQEPISYATALAALVSPDSNYSTLVVAATNEPTYLFNRIKRIVEMKKNTFSYSRMAAALLIIVTFVCCIAFLPPTPNKPGKKESTATAAKTEAAQTVTKTNELKMALPEETQLLTMLMQDRVVDQVKGFVVEKKENDLFIDGKKQPEEMAVKYLSSLKQKNIRVQVNSFLERMRQHPDAGFMQVLLPVSNSSGCVEYKSSARPKDGC